MAIQSRLQSVHNFVCAVICLSIANNVVSLTDPTSFMNKTAHPPIFVISASLLTNIIYVVHLPLHFDLISCFSFQMTHI